ncbi:cardiac-enriched FHL2-interacting protein [Rhinoraja longicauda]
MESFKNRGAAKTRVMQGHSKPVDGFSDTSSAGSFLDEADREVSSLTERAFKSLCVVEEGMCSEFEVHSSSSVANVNQAAPGPGVTKHSVGGLKNCKMSPKLIKKQAKELPETFQESAAQYSVGGEKGEKGNLGNGCLVETKVQKAKGSSLPRDVDHNKMDLTGTNAINAEAASSLHPEPAGEDGVKDIGQFDVSAIINLHREKSSFSTACQESYWVNKKHLPQAKGSKTNILGYLKASQYRKPTDLKNLNPTGKRLDKALSEKISRLQKADTMSSFLHSECSAFKSWRDHSKSLFEEDNPLETHYPSLQSNVHWQGSDEAVIVQMQAPSLTQVKSPNKVMASVMQNLVIHSPCNKDAAHVPASVPEENHYIVKESQDPGNNLQGAKCEDGGGGTVENGVEEKGFQLWRNSRFPLHKKQMEAELVSTIPATRCPAVAEAATVHAAVAEAATVHAAVAEAATVHAAVAQEDTSLCISKLLTPNMVPNVNGIETSTTQPIMVTPPLLSQPLANQSDEIRGDTQSLLGYKCKASSLLYNLTDVRKRVKSTYNAGVPLNTAEPARDKYVFQNIHQTSARTSSAPVRLSVRENCAKDANDQGKVDKMPSVAPTRPTTARLKAAEIPQAELDPWKDDDYLNLRSPQTVRDAAGYPWWRSRSSRPQSAMTSLEVHEGRCRDRRSSQQLNKTNTEKADLPAKAFQSARNSPERVAIAQEKEEQKQNRFHGGRKPGCELVSHPQNDVWPHDSQPGEQEGSLMPPRLEDGGTSTMEQGVTSHKGPYYPAGEATTGHDVKSPAQSYIDLGNSHPQGHELMNDWKQACTGWNVDALQGRPAVENDKSSEKIELQYYALSDPTINSEGAGEKQNEPLVFHSHSQQETSRVVPQIGTKDSGPVGSCEEKLGGIFFKHQECGPGSNGPTSPRLGLFKGKDSAPNSPSVTKPTKLLLPKGAGGLVGMDTLKETPTMLRPNQTREEGRRHSGAVSVTPNARPDSTCSVDSKAAGKPPVVPPKSEKALRRAKKLATRRKRTENKQEKQNGDADIALSSNVPMCPPSLPTSPVPSNCPTTPPHPLTSCDSPAMPNDPAATSTQPFTPAPSFPLSQRKLLQDPESGQYFVVDVPLHVQRKTLYDPDTGDYFQVSIPSAGGNTTLDFLHTSYVLYPGFPSLPLLSTVRPPSQMSAPAALLELQKDDEPLNERTNFDLGFTEEQENQPYIETLYEPYAGSRAGSEETWCSPMSSQTQAGDHDLELIIMGELEDIAMENN